MFYTPPSLFDPPTYPRKKLPLAGSPPEQTQPQPEPTARVPYRPTEEASPRPPGNTIPLIFRALAHPSQRRPKAAAAAYSDAFPALQSQTQPASAPAPFQSPAQPPQTPPTASPGTLSTEEAPKAAPAFQEAAAHVEAESTYRDQSPTATAAPGQQLSSKPTDATPQSPSQPPSTPAPAQSPAQPPQTPPTPSPAPQSTEEAPKVAAAFKEAAAPQSPNTPAPPAPQSPSQSTTQPAPPQPSAAQPQTPPAATPAPQSTEENDPKAVDAVNKATAQAEAADALRKQRAPRRTMLESAGLGGAATSLEALEDEVQARHAELEKKFPQHGPEYQAGMKAILQHIQQQQAQIKARADQLPEIAARIYQQWGKGVAGSWTTGQALRENDRDSPGAPLSQSHLDALNQEAAKYGIDPKDLRHHLEMQRVTDWSRGDTSAAVRYGPGGSIWVNPDRYLDENAYRQAVEKSGGSEAEKAAAMSRFPELQQRAAKAQLDPLRTLGVYNQWEASQPEGMSDAEKLAKFRQEHSGIFSSGAWKVRMHQALLGVASAVVGLAKSAVGTYEAATRSPGALDLYEKLSRDAASISSSSAALPTGQLVHMGTSMVVSSAPSLGVGGLVSLTLKAGGAAFGLRTAAQVAQAAQTWGLRGAAATAGLQTFGGMYGDAVQGYMNRGDSESTALNKAFIPALAGAASTYLLTAAGGTQGIEALLRQPAFKENFRQWFKAVAAGSVKEGLREEAPDQLIQGIIERYTYNPDKPWKDIIEETLQAGIGGALLGGAAEATTTGLAPAKTSQDQPQPPIPPNTTPVGRPSTPPLSVEQSQKLIHNVMNRPPEQRGHPTTQADLAQAQWVVREQLRKLESQTTPLSDAQKKELADAKAALARTEQSLPNQQHVSGNTPTAEVNAPAPRFQEKNPELLEQHRKKLESKRNAPRNAQSEAALLQAPDERARNANPASDSLHRHNEAGALVKTGEMGGKHINEANILEAPDGNAALHKPDDGQSEKKIRAGVEPGTTGHREVAASKIAQALGIDLVPPTTMLTHDGRPGSAQVFKKGMINGEFAADPSNGYNIKINRNTQLPEGLPSDTAHDWQLTDDLLMHSDRHSKNYMLRVENGKIVEAALVDNGHSLPANTGVVEKRYPGPLEGQPISPLNEARLHRMLDNEESLRQSLKEHLEPEAIDGLFARAKALLARGKYGNFTLDEINAHLPPDKQRARPVAWHDHSAK